MCTCGVKVWVKRVFDRLDTQEVECPKCKEWWYTNLKGVPYADASTTDNNSND